MSNLFLRRATLLAMLAVGAAPSFGQIQAVTPEPKDIRLREAIEASDLAAVRNVLDSGFDLNRPIADSDPGEERKTPLALAADDGEQEIFDLLLNRGASPNSAVKDAGEADDSYYILALYHKGADIFEVQPALAEYDSAETTAALKEAIAKGRSIDPDREAKTLVRAMFHPINKRLPAGEIEKAVPEVIQVLLESGCDPNGIIDEVDEQGNTEETTFLVRALHAGRYLTAEELIRRGANVNQTFAYYKNSSTSQRETETALMEFSRLGRPALVRFLLLNHADPRIRNSDGFSALTLAIEALPYQGIIDSLLTAGADPNERLAPENVTPLMIAVSKEDTATINTLLGHGADPGLADRFGRHLKDFAKPQSTLFCSPPPDPKNTQQTTQLLRSMKGRKTALPSKALDPVTAIDVARDADRLARSGTYGERDSESDDAERRLRRVCLGILNELISRPGASPQLDSALSVYSTYYALTSYADGWAALSEDIKGGTSYIKYSISTDAFLDVVRNRKKVLAKLVFNDPAGPQFTSTTRDPFAEQSRLFLRVRKKTQPSNNSARDYTTLLQLWKNYRKNESNLARQVLNMRKQTIALLPKFDRYSVDQHNLQIKETIDRLHAYQ